MSVSGTNYPDSAARRVGHRFAAIECDGDLDMGGHKDGQILLENAFEAITASAWVHTTSGHFYLVKAKTGSTAVLPVVGLKVGDELTGYRILGQACGSAAASGSTINVGLCRVPKSSTGVSIQIATSTPVEYITTTSLDVTSDTTLSHTVIADNAYCFWISGTTDNSDDAALYLAGVEVDVNRK